MASPPHGVDRSNLSIVHLDTSSKWRGGQLQVFLLHRELLGRGFSSLLVVRSGSALHRRCRDEGLAVAPVRVMRQWHPRAVVAVWRLARRASIVHAHDSHGAGLAALAGLLGLRGATVCHRRVAYPFTVSSVARWKYRAVDEWIAVSSEIAQVLCRAGVDPRRCRVIPSALDIDRLRAEAAAANPTALRDELGIDQRATVLVTPAALVRQKGHKVLIRAAPLVLEAIPNAVFVCVGEGPLRNSLSRRAAKCGVDDHFRFLGFRADVAAILRIADVVCLPSVEGEGSSAAVKEALALGRPVVASDLPGIVEVLGRGGIVVPAGEAKPLAVGILAALDGRPGNGDGNPRLNVYHPRVMADAVIEAYFAASRISRPAGGL